MSSVKIDDPTYQKTWANCKINCTTRQKADELSAKISDLRTILADYDDTYEQQLREAETEKERLKKLIMEKQTK